jgi:hypothetical protein
MLPPYIITSFELRSRGIVLKTRVESPKRALTQLLKKKVGASKYNSINKYILKIGNKSKQKLKNKNSDIKKIDPGKPKKIRRLIREKINSLGHKKFTPLISVISRVLNLLLIASTRRNEFVDKRAWLINIQNPDSIKHDCPLIMHIVSQCISTTVE